MSQIRVSMITPTANQAIAADVSGNGTIASYDSALISQFRVGMITRFPVAVTRGADWAFVPASRNYTPFNSDRSGEDYIGILYGDVTGNWSPSAFADGGTIGATPGDPEEAAEQQDRLEAKAVGALTFVPAVVSRKDPALLSLQGWRPAPARGARQVL